VIRWDSGISATSPCGAKGYAVFGSDSRCARWCSLAYYLRQSQGQSSETEKEEREERGKYSLSSLAPAGYGGSSTYKWQSTVSAHAYLWLVRVDEDSGMAQWSSTSITFYNALMCPSNWLFVDQADGCLRGWLFKALA
jgi:hypothetical protein